jgi:hypothetical protein
MRRYHSVVVMATIAPIDIKEHLVTIESHLKEVRQDVSEILCLLQDELRAFREREFWRDYSETYHKE